MTAKGRNFLFFPTLREGKLTAKGRKKFFSQRRSENGQRPSKNVFCFFGPFQAFFALFNDFFGTLKASKTPTALHNAEGKKLLKSEKNA